MGDLTPRTAPPALPQVYAPPTLSPSPQPPGTLANGSESGRLQILIVDDDRTLREGSAAVLRADGYSVTTCGRSDEAIELLGRRRFDIAVVDVYMAPVSGLEVLRAALATHRDTLVVMMTGNATVASSLEAIRDGAWDYLAKPFCAAHLQVLVGRAAHVLAAAREMRETHEQVTIQSGRESILLLGRASVFRRAVELARRVAQTDASVLITGESGTGKEVIAQFIHANSQRSAKSLVPINCAAMPEPLLESEMFGHRKGAFTGADREKPGLLEIADGGTLFLDELTEMSLPLQAKLLRVIQDGVVRRVGSEQRDAVVNVRFLSATNRDPAQAVREGKLREDLFYRLRVVPIKLPPLRERLEDIPLLAEHFLTHYWLRHHPAARAVPRLSARSREYLRARLWPGNVRELQNVIEHLAVLAEAGQEIEPGDIPVGDEPVPPRAEMAVAAAETNEAFHQARDRLLAQFERHYLSRLVMRAHGNMAKAARLASIDRTTLYRLMDKHSVQREDLLAISSER